jgi:cytochrome c-type biogenesis protein CcmH
MTASPNHDRPAGAWIVAAAIFLLVAGIGAALSYLRDAPAAIGEGDTLPLLLSHSESNDEMLQRLADYAGSSETGEPGSAAPADTMLPDVNTMIDRLADRLKTSPNDIEGWRMLGWSYFQTGRYQQAATAYARAVELDPRSAEFKRAYDDAKAKAAEGGDIETASPLPTETAGNGENPRVDTIAASEATPPNEREAAIRSMVEGLANRLESSPRDIEGWTLLMRSRVVLGEKAVAVTALRKALEVFKDDTAASGKIAAAATELGLKAE